MLCVVLHVRLLAEHVPEYGFGGPRGGFGVPGGGFLCSSSGSQLPPPRKAPRGPPTPTPGSSAPSG